MTSERRPLERSPLWQLTATRTIVFLREPEALFWIFAFPVLMALALGIAFRNQGPQRIAVGVVEGPGAAQVERALERSPDLEVKPLAAGAAGVALRRGRVAVVVRARAGRAPLLEYDPARPETRLAHLATVDALERAAGRTDPVSPESRIERRPGARYIDFLVPGLIGLGLLGTGMWGVGFPIATMRQQKLLKRLRASPMRRSHFLLSLMLARLAWLVPEVAAITGFGAVAFGTAVRGSWLGFVLVCVVGAFAFSALGVLVASRARTIEAVSGLMNVAMLPMWLLSGSFFPADRFPDAMQPFIRALPLTQANDALRAIMNEGAGLAAVALPLAVLVAWALAAFAAALAIFRWE